MVWINKDTGVVLSKDGHTLFVDLVAEDEERERLAERSGLADPHGDIPDKEYLEAAVIIHDNGHAHGEYEDLSDHAGFLTDLLDEARGRLDGFGLSGPECGAGMDADAMGVQGPAR